MKIAANFLVKERIKLIRDYSIKIHIRKLS